VKRLKIWSLLKLWRVLANLRFYLLLKRYSLIGKGIRWKSGDWPRCVKCKRFVSSRRGCKFHPPSRLVKAEIRAIDKTLELSAGVMRRINFALS